MACRIVIALLFPAVGYGQSSIEDRILNRFQIDRFEFVELRLPVGAPNDWVVVVPRSTERSWRLELTKKSLRSSMFRVRVQDSSGQFTEVTPPELRTYRGGVRGCPGATVTAQRRDDGLWARLRWPDGRQVRIHPLKELDPSAPAERHVVFTESVQDVACGVCRDSTVSHAPEIVVAPSMPAGTSLSCGLETCEIAFDCDYEYFLLQGADVNATVTRVETILADVEAFYVRDLLVTYELTEVVVRAAPFYASTGGGSLLSLFRDEWSTTLASTPRDVVHLMTNKSDLSGFAGLAYVGVVCSQAWGYGWSVDSAGVVGHELGHNWNASHCHDPYPCNNMCGACLTIGPETLDIMLDFKDSRPCLSDAGSYPTPVLPYGHRDRFVLTEAEVLSGSPVPMAVLTNDHDANCDLLTISSHDTVSEKGASVVFSFGGGVGGSDGLVYFPPPGGFAGNDRFEYVLSDGTFEVVTEVIVHVSRPRLMGHWSFDESSGGVAYDTSGNDLTGSVQGTSFDESGVEGRFAGALDLSGIETSVRIARPDLYTDSLTVTAWLQRDGPQPDWAGIVVCRSRNTNAGLTLGPDDDLRYLWGSGGWEFDPGLTLADGEWTFVAMVVTPSDVTLYAGEPDSLGSETFARVHDMQPFDGDLNIGFDSANDSRRFVGSIDDVRLYGYALSPADVAQVGRGDRARGPVPAHLERGVSREVVLACDPCSAAILHRFYLGSDRDAVGAAVIGDPEYRGTFVTPFLDPNLLAPATRYYWRVDSTTTTETISGEVWEFETGTLRFRDGLQVHYSCDPAAISGVTLVDLDETPIVDGTLQGAVPSPEGFLLGCIEFDGVDDRVVLPVLDLDTDRLTVSTWLRRSGPQSDWAGIFFSRSGSTIAGLNFGYDNELRYHWNDGHWGWNSGLVVPDAMWVHAAWVIEPDRAAIYLDGVGAHRIATHRIEAFDGLSYLGHDTTSSARRFSGRLDDIAIWERALSSDEVRTIHRRGRLGSSFEAEAGPSFVRGDANGDGVFDIADAITTLDWLFGPGSASCELAMDSNDDDQVDVGDVITTLGAIFTAGTLPPNPYPTCGIDPTPGGLGCTAFFGC